MKRALALLALTFGSIGAWAAALGSIYNGEQYNLGGVLLVQSADQPDDFYILPTHYTLATESYYDYKTGVTVNRAKVSNEIVTVNGHPFSTYIMHFELDMPGLMTTIQATSALRVATGRNVNIKGLAPICGLRIADGGFDRIQGDSSSKVAAPGPEDTLIQYSISSTADDKCTSILDTTEFTMQYRVPIDQEPSTAKLLMGDSGPVLPSIELVMPYKFKNTVTLSIDAESAIQQLKAGADISGTFKAVTARVKASIEQLISRQQTTSQFVVDCQDPTACQQFIEMAKDAWAKELYTYTSLAGAGDTNPLTLADNDKAASGSMIKAEVGFDQQEAKRIGRFTHTFSANSYTAITTQAQVSANHIPFESFAPSIQAQLPKPGPAPAPFKPVF